jgi:hypothetical protein
MVDNVPGDFHLSMRRCPVWDKATATPQTLWREPDHRRFKDPRADQAASGEWLRPLYCVCRQDPIFVLDRRKAARRAVQP